jgi:hypothetical protein
MTEPRVLTWPESRRYRVTPFRPGDHFLIEARADFAAEHEAAGRPLDDGRIHDAMLWTLWRGQTPIGIGGLAQGRAGRCEVFAYLGAFKRADWGYALSAVRTVMAFAREHWGARRFQATARCALPGAAALLERLGFARAGEADGYFTMSREAER